MTDFTENQEDALKTRDFIWMDRDDPCLSTSHVRTEADLKDTESVGSEACSQKKLFSG